MARDDVLITVEALAGLDEVDLLDVRWRLGDADGAGRERYLAGHIPGARFLDLESVLTSHGEPTDGRHPLPGYRWWRLPCWLGGALLLVYGAANAMGAWLVLARVVSTTSSDRPALIGHAALWDSLFALWGALLLGGLTASRGRRAPASGAA